MCPTSKNERSVNELLRDPLIRLVMDSDGVTEQAMIGVLEHLRIALAARQGPSGWRRRRSASRQEFPAAQREFANEGRSVGTRRRVCSGWKHREQCLWESAGIGINLIAASAVSPCR
jgi:hypothetical protein